MIEKKETKREITHLDHLITPTARPMHKNIIPRHAHDALNGDAVVDGDLEADDITDLDIFTSAVSVRDDGTAAPDFPAG